MRNRMLLLLMVTTTTTGCSGGVDGGGRDERGASGSVRAYGCVGSDVLGYAILRLRTIPRGRRIAS
jgi:hypothetical protein